MDFFCQRCGKNVEVDESLLRIDLPMGDLARGDVDLDRLLATKGSLRYSNNSLKVATRMSTSSSTPLLDKSFKNMPVSASFVLPSPRKPPQTESPIPKNLPNFNRPNKTRTILLKNDKPPPTISTNFSSSTPSSSSSSSATPPSPNSSSASSQTSTATTTPKTASPPHFPFHAPPASPPTSNNNSTSSSTSSSSSLLSSPNHHHQHNPLHKAKSEFFRLPADTNNETSENGKLTPSNSRKINLAQHKSGLSHSQTMTRSPAMTSSSSAALMSQSVIVSHMPDPHVGSLSSLRYIRDAKRTTRKAGDIFADSSLSATPSQPTHSSSLHHHPMHSFPSAPNLQSLTSSSSSVNHSMSLADAQAAAKLFQLVSEQIGVDLPLCNECTKTLTFDLEDELSMLESQNTSYLFYLDQLEQKEKAWTPISDIEDEILKLEEEERELHAQIAALGEQKRETREDVNKLKAEAAKLVNFEERYWMNFDELHSALSTFIDEKDACNVQTTNTKELLRVTQRTQIINDAFHIWHDGHFGTINSFRLGRLPSQPVDWNEINAAWGLATLLLYNMAKRIKFDFTTYKLIPAGSNSKMEHGNSNYELFGSSDISLGRLFWYRRFDNGMVAFLHCLKEMGDFAESKDKTFKLPHKMEKDKVGEMSIKIQFNNEETWTKSLKYTLTNLKWLLAWVVRMEAEDMAKKKSLNNNNNNNNNNSSSSVSNGGSGSCSSSDFIVNNNRSSINNSNNNNNHVSTVNSINNMPPIANPPAASRSRLTMLFSRSGNS